MHRQTCRSHRCIGAALTLAAALLSTSVTAAVLAAAGALLSGCGGAEADAPAGASDAQVALLDLDALGSIDAAAREAAAARGAPGEAEPVLYVVRARVAQQAEQAAAELSRRGFGPRQVAAMPGPER